MELTGGQRKKLREALQAAFPAPKALARMVDEELDVRLTDITADGPMPDMAYALIQWAQKEGRVRELLDRACAANPGNPELVALQAIFTSRGGEKVQPVNHSLEALSELREYSGVRDKVLAFRHYFQAARKQIALVGDFKELHDTLHDVQLGLYDEIGGAIGRFTEQGEAAKWDLREYRSTLNDTYIRRVKAVVAGQGAAVAEANEVLARLEQASEQLGLGIEQTSVNMLDAARRSLTKVLAIWPGRIDQALYTAARILPLRELAEALDVVCREVDELNLNPEKKVQFARGIEALQELDVSLKMKTDAHYKWQEVDMELRRVADSLDRDTAELVITWPDLRAQAENLAHVNTDGWGADFLVASAELDTVVMVNDVARVRPPFRRYRRMASRRFYEVDKALREQCGLLRTTCEPLDAVLGMF
jgi:hypothetical protein